jgi:hypothetical protein
MIFDDNGSINTFEYSDQNFSLNSNRLRTGREIPV